MIRVILERLEKRFGSIAAIDGVSLELRPGEVTYVLGPPGAGKTTLARLVTGLEESGWRRDLLRRPAGAHASSPRARRGNGVRGPGALAGVDRS